MKVGFPIAKLGGHKNRICFIRQFEKIERLAKIVPLGRIVKMLGLGVGDEGSKIGRECLIKRLAFVGIERQFEFCDHS